MSNARRTLPFSTVRVARSNLSGARLVASQVLVRTLIASVRAARSPNEASVYSYVQETADTGQHSVGVQVVRSRLWPAAADTPVS